ncbi:MAG TPA: lytic transglycosylase F [Terriglobales bacterium]|nr:lytic transglycosylase F [Terriglobales bacterium]
MSGHLSNRPWALAAVLVATFLLPGPVAKPALSEEPATSPTVQQQANTSGITFSAPYGRHTDDLEGMLKRRNIRALVLINPIGFFYDNGQPMGVDYQALSALETFVNQKYKTRALKVQVTFIPVRPDQIEAALQQGIGDVIAYALVITPGRQQQVAFTVPLQENVDQIVVSGPKFGSVSSLEGLGGKQIYLSPLLASYEKLQQVSQNLQKAGKPPILIKDADKNLLEDDLVEMVNSGMIPATVTSATRAKLWAQVLPNLTPHYDLVIASGQQTAWAVRKNSPQLKQLLDEFIAPRALGTSFGNTLLRRYLQNTQWVKNSISPDEMKKFQTLVAYFKKYGNEYGFDYLMIAAQGYQESRLEQNKRGPDGAVGIMQVIPKYAAAPPISVPNVTTAEDNIEAGVKMLYQIERQYFNDPKIDRLNRTLMAFASYNAGPNRIAQLRQQAQKQGLDPNVWFGNVELVVAQDIGQVTVTYVGNVYKYFVAYQLAMGDQAQKTSGAQTGH